MCGGDLKFEEGATTCECEFCGSTNTLPALDNREQRANLYNRANRLRMQSEFDKALAAYEKILDQDNTDAEAHWGAVLSRWGIEYVVDPVSGERIPTCHRVQTESILADPDYQAALENTPYIAAKEAYAAQARRIAEIQRDILAISQKEQPYDVFICYKETDAAGQRTKDSALAQEIYYQLIQEGYKVFFSRITLEDKLGQAYEPYIFAALNSARVMLVVGTRPEHFEAVWVKNEWSRYLRLMRDDRSRLLIPCYRDMDPYDLPEELSNLQSQDMGKIGFMQDLLRGVKKVLDAQKQEKPQDTPRQAAVTGRGNANLKNLYRRAELFLEDGDFASAREYADKILDEDAEFAPAYMVKVLSARKYRSEQELENNCADSGLANDPNMQKAIRFAEGDSRYSRIAERVGKNEAFVSAAKLLGIKLDAKRGAQANAASVQQELKRRVDQQGTNDTEAGAYREAAAKLKKLGAYPHAAECVALCEELAEIMPVLKKYIEIAGALGIALDTACDGEANALTVQQELERRVGGQGTSNTEADTYREAAEKLEALGVYLHATECAALCEKLAELTPVIKKYDALCAEWQRLRNSDHWERCKKLSSEFAKLDDFSNSQELSVKAAKTAEAIVQGLYDSGVDKIKAAGIHKEADEGFALVKTLAGEISIAEAEKLYAQKKEEIDAAMEAAERRKQADLARWEALDAAARRRKIICAAMVLLALAVGVYLFVIVPMMKYNAAKELYTTGQYEAAITAYEALNGYSDSAMQIKVCKYAAAKKLYVAEQYEAAISAYEALDGYSDSATQIKVCKYAVAKKLYAAGQYEAAITAFEALNGYSDSAAQVVACQEAIRQRAYDAAKALMDEGRYEEAYAAFLTMQGYADVDTLLATDDHLIATAAIAPFKKVGNCVIFGHYEQDNDESNGMEEIEWLVLDYNAATNQALLISRYGLDARAYHSTTPYPTWEKSDIRKWLNGTFLTIAFTPNEQNAIVTSTISTPDYNGNPGGNDTKDKIWLLSTEEAAQYFKDDNARKTIPTTYAAAQEAYQYGGSDNDNKLDGTGCCWWWLRSPGNYGSYASRVNTDGSLNSILVNFMLNAVRPTLLLDLGSYIP